MQPLHLKRLTEGLKVTKRSTDDDIDRLFTNVVCIHPPKVISSEKKKLKINLNYPNVFVFVLIFCYSSQEEDLLRIFNKQLDEDRRIVISRSNRNELEKVCSKYLSSFFLNK